MALTLISLCLAVTSSARAQSSQPAYSSPTYSGGQWSLTQFGTTTTGGYQSAYPGWGCAKGYSFGNDRAPFGGAASCSGPVTASFPWAGAAAPPPVIAAQTCTALWGPTTPPPGTTVSGSATNPLGASGSMAVTQYSIKPGAAPFSLTCSPAANVTADGTASGPYATNGASIGVTYSVAVYPVTISLGGATPVAGAQEALTGQPVTASVVIGAPVGDPTAQPASAFKVKSAQWDIESEDGGSLVGGYTAEQAEGATTSPTPLNSPTVTFYDGIQDTVTINVTATILFPDNTTGTVACTSQIAIEEPKVTDPQCYLVENDNLAADEYGAQENMDYIQITMPPNFTGGVGCIVQEVESTSRVDARTGGGNYSEQEDPTGTGAWEAIPAPCLDTDFPYPYGSSYTTGNNQFHAGWAVNPQTQGEAYDYPYVTYTPPLVSTDTSNNTNWNNSTTNDHFNDWVMYNPSATSGGGIWIPLKKFSWYWSNTASLNTNTNTWSAPSFKGDSGNGTVAPATDWPTWDAFVLYSSTSEIQFRPQPQ